jgi:protein SCO1/2
MDLPGKAQRSPNPLPWVALAAVALIALVALLAIRGIGANRTAGQPSASSNGLVGEAVMSPSTIKAPNFLLSDQNGKQVSLQQFQGRVVAVTFLDSHCQQQCPLQGEQLGIAMRKLSNNSPFTLLVVSVAPSTDTPESVKAFATMHRWTDEWHWLNGNQAQVEAVWKSYGVQVLNGPTGNIPHSIALYLIDRQGYERVAMLSTDPQRIEQDVRLLSKS